MTEGKDNLIPSEPEKEVVKTEKKVTPTDVKVTLKKGLIVMLIALLLGALVGFGTTSIVLGAKNNKEKTFTASEFQITLTEGFSEKLVAGVTMAYSSPKVSVSFRKAAFTESTRNFSADQYARSVVLASGLIAEVKTDGDLTYFSTEGKSAGGVKMTSFIYAFKTDECFWIVEFNVKQNHANRFEKTIKKYAESIVFN